MVMTTVVTDDFNRADANPIGSPWTTSPGGSADTQIVSQVVQPTVFTGARSSSFYGNARYFNMRSTITISAHNSSLGQVGCSVRASTVSTYDEYSVYCGGEFEMAKIVGGAFTSLAATSGNSPAVGNTAGVQAIGTTIKVYEDGSEILSQTDSALESGAWGINALIFSGSNLTVERLNDFVGELDITGAPPTSNSINSYANAWF